MAPPVTVYEVGPRDGLQNEARSVPTADKLALVRALADAGLRRIEATSFVSPRWIPQLADAAEVTAALPRMPGRLVRRPRPEREGARAARRSARAGRRGAPARRRRRVPLGLGEPLEAQHQPEHRGGARGRGDARPGRALPRAPRPRLRLDGVGLPVRGEASTRRGRPRSSRGCSRSAATRCRSATRSASGRRDQTRASSTVVSCRAPGPTSSRCTCTTRAARRSRTCSSALEEGITHLRRVDRRAGRVPVRARRLGEPRHRGPRLHAARDGTSRPGSTGSGSSRPAPSRSGSSGAACPARRSRRSSRAPPPKAHGRARDARADLGRRGRTRLPREGRVMEFRIERRDGGSRSGPSTARRGGTPSRVRC